MNTAKWSSKVSAARFYEAMAYNCPNCQAKLKVLEDPAVVQASDVMFDRCSECGTYIYINMLGGTPVIFEGFSDPDKMYARARELAHLRKERPASHSAAQPQYQSPRRKSLPWWKRLLGKKQ